MAENGNPRDRWRWRWTFLVLAAAAAVLVFIFPWDQRWDFLGIFPIHPLFADLVAILAAGQAYRAGLDPYSAPNPFDPLGRPHVYGPGWLLTGSLGLRTGDALWIGPLVVAAFVVTACLVLAPRRTADAAAALLLVCSPPVLLGINRANNDLLVFIGLAFAAWLLARRSLAPVGDAVVALVAMLKIYPLAVAPMALFSPRGRRASLLAIGGVFVAVSVVFWVWRHDFASALRIAPRPQTVFAYGLPTFAITWRALPGLHATYVLGLAAGFTGSSIALWRRWREIWRSVPSTGLTGLCFVAGATAWPFCYLANTNYAYRLALLLLPARLWLATAPGSAGYIAARVQLLLWIFVAWLSLPKNWWADMAKNQTLSHASWTWFRLIIGVEQSVIAVLTGALAVAVAGALVRKLSEPRWPAISPCAARAP